MSSSNVNLPEKYVIKKEIIVIKTITFRETKMGPGRRRPGPVREIIT